MVSHIFLQVSKLTVAHSAYKCVFAVKCWFACGALNVTHKCTSSLLGSYILRLSAHFLPVEI